MKTTLYSLLAAAACGMALGQTAYTTPVGYTTQTLPQAATTPVGINLLKASLSQGLVSSVVFPVSPGTTTEVNVTGANFLTSLPAGKTYIFEVLSGTLAGTVQDFVTYTDTQITLPAVLTGLGATDSYRVRAANVLQGLFPVGLLKGSSGPTNADKVYVPDGSGGFTIYWYRSIGTNPPQGWYTTVDGTSSATIGAAVTAEVPLVYLDGVYVQKVSGTDSSLVISGEVKKTSTNTLVIPGVNIIGVTPPVGSTLFTSGLFPGGGLGGSSGPTNADTVYVPNGTGGYTLYWYRSIGTNPPQGWYTTVDGTSSATIGAAVTSDVPLPPSILIDNKKPAKVIKISVPAGFSNL